jgi:hypothetical protein
MRSDRFQLDNTSMAHFRSPDEPDDEPAEDKDRFPSLEAVRLLGTQLHDHPEACKRIASRAQLRDLQIRVAYKETPESQMSLIQFRLRFEDDHFTIQSGASDGAFNTGAHEEMVRVVRDAALRPLDERNLEFTLRSIEKRSQLVDAPKDQPSVLDESQSDEAAGS